MTALSELPASPPAPPATAPGAPGAAPGAGGPAGEALLALERLDRPVTVLSARLWAGVAALVLLVGAAAAWLTLGSLPRSADGPALVVHGPGPVVARAAVAGAVTEVLATAGERVAAGQPLALLSTGSGTVGVPAPAAGIVTGLLAAPGTQLPAGGAAATVDPAGSPASVLLFLPASAVPPVPGRPVSVAVAGMMLSGRVSTVGTYALTAVDLAARFGSVTPGGTADLVDTRLVSVALPGAVAASPALSGLPAGQARVDLGGIRPWHAVLGRRS